MPVAISAVEIGRKTTPTTPPLEFTELHRLPPRSKSGRKTTPTTPLEFTELHRLPPRSKSGRKTTPTTPPVEFTELHRLPPVEIGPENYRPLLLDDLDPPLSDFLTF